ncbi:ligase activity, forming aminoacyl-tRNA and related compounds protein [[Candida] boidinii]|nr:ligase activity, forming aminoacyl-tRNA and related compounds protein [[Candida] boidinii]
MVLPLLDSFTKLSMSNGYSSTVIGALACQQNSYLKELNTEIVSCNQVTDFQKFKNLKLNSIVKNYQDSEQDIFEIESKDTILFPEGGGQPSDSGELINLSTNEIIPVFAVYRDGLIARHLTTTKIDPNTDIKIKLNWEKRFDHMQQHTGQHLLSAILDNYDIPTLSWNMGETINYIEINKKLSDEEMTKFSNEFNNLITENSSINLITPHPSDFDKSIDTEKGLLRSVKIDNLNDNNPCCGTHLNSTGQLKGLILLNQISGKNNNSKLNFIIGDRIFKFSENNFKILKNLNGLLSCDSNQLSEKLTLLQKNFKKSSSRESTFIKELAILNSDILKQKIENSNSNSNDEILTLYKSNMNLDFINQIFKNLNPIINEKTVILLVGDVNEIGYIIIFGKKTTELSEEFKKIFENLKGGGKNNKFQAKIPNLSKNELNNAINFINSLN